MYTNWIAFWDGVYQGLVMYNSFMFIAPCWIVMGSIAIKYLIQYKWKLHSMLMYVAYPLQNTLCVGEKITVSDIHILARNLDSTEVRPDVIKQFKEYVVDQAPHVLTHHLWVFAWFSVLDLFMVYYGVYRPLPYTAPFKIIVLFAQAAIVAILIDLYINYYRYVLLKQVALKLAKRLDTN